MTTKRRERQSIQPLRIVIKQIEARKQAIAEHRDALRVILSDLEDVVSSTDEGVDGLERAIDELSKYL